MGYFLYAIGLDSVSLKWLESYLTCRSQIVDVHDSDPSTVTYRVPQWSILGLLIYSMSET